MSLNASFCAAELAVEGSRAMRTRRAAARRCRDAPLCEGRVALVVARSSATPGDSQERRRPGPGEAFWRVPESGDDRAMGSHPCGDHQSAVGDQNSNKDHNDRVHSERPNLHKTRQSIMQSPQHLSLSLLSSLSSSSWWSRSGLPSVAAALTPPTVLPCI